MLQAQVLWLDRGWKFQAAEHFCWKTLSALLFLFERGGLRCMGRKKWHSSLGLGCGLYQYPVTIENSACLFPTLKKVISSSPRRYVLKKKKRDGKGFKEHSCYGVGRQVSTVVIRREPERWDVCCAGLKQVNLRSPQSIGSWHPPLFVSFRIVRTWRGLFFPLLVMGSGHIWSWRPTCRQQASVCSAVFCHP